MTPLDPSEQKTPELHGGVPNDIPSPRAARVSFVLALVAFAGGAVCIVGEQAAPAVIFLLAGVAGIMTSSRAWRKHECTE